MVERQFIERVRSPEVVDFVVRRAGFIQYEFVVVVQHPIHGLWVRPQEAVE